jgi:hypothetical protein
MDITILGTKKEQETFKIVNQHYQMALEDLEARYPSWDTKIELFYSYINEKNWPYSAEIFVPETFTALFEKMARLNGGKPRGRLVPREGGDVAKAKINNELLDFQWDDAVRVDKEPMVAKYAKLDLNARIYGAGFGIVKWRYEADSEGNVIFDGPVLRVLNNRDCLPNPAYSTVKNWFQYRDYLTIDEMERVNDASSSKSQYKNLKLLKASVVESSTGTGDLREINYTPKGRSLQGLSDYLGKDEDPLFRIVEVITEYRDDRVIVFAPKHGVILRDSPNPYKHRRIPVVCLKYIPVDDDIYGMSEIEPVEKVQKAMNALTSQYVDTINMELYRILQVNPTEVQMHTLEWGPGKKWLMNRPGQSVVPLESATTTSSNFVNVYSVLVSMFKEGMGEASGAFSTLQPFGNKKTATEIQSTTTTRTIRDNFNQIFLSEVIKEQMLLWLLMDMQFIFQDPAKTSYVLRIVGRDAIKAFTNMGYSNMITPAEEVMRAETTVFAGGEPLPFEMSPEFPVNMGGDIKPKLEVDEMGEGANLYITPEDMVGVYDYIPNVEPMRVGASDEEKKNRMDALTLVLNPSVQKMLQEQGKQVNIEELLLDVFDSSGLKGADKYFEDVQQGEQVGDQANQGGVGANSTGGASVAAQATGGMENPGGMATQQGAPLVGGSQGI